MHNLLIASVLAFVQPDVTLQGTEASVPMDHSTGHAAVNVLINGAGPYLFQVDTYASGLMYVDDDFAAELELEKVGTVRNSDGHTVREVDQVTLGDVRLGGLTIGDARATVLDFDWIDRADGKKVYGLIGFASFESLTVTYDYPNSRMLFSKQRLQEELPNTIPFSTENTGSPDIRLALGDREVVFGIDTGSASALTIDLKSSDGLPFEAELEKVGKATTVYASYDVYRGVLAAPLDFGGHAVNGLTMTVIDNGGKGMVGYRLLSSYAVSFDQRSGLMRMVRPPLPEPKRLTDEERRAWIGTYVRGQQRFVIEEKAGELFFLAPGGSSQLALPLSAQELVLADGPGRLFLRPDSPGSSAKPGIGIQSLPKETIREAKRVDDE